jgi:hypothetical protein
MDEIKYVAESEFAKALGLLRKDMRAARKNMGMQLAASDGPIVLDWIAAKRLADNLGVSEPVAAEAFKKAGAGQESDQDEKAAHGEAGEEIAMELVNEVEVVDCRLKNRHIIICGVDDKKERVRVRVRDNSGFRPGMRIPVRHVSGTLFEFAGRYPRNRRAYWAGVKNG